MNSEAQARMDADVLVSGAGPAGLCLAVALAGSGLRMTLVESQTPQALADPAFDGREIALTQHAVGVLRQLSIWQRIDAHAQSPLRDARIMNGASPSAMVISHALSAHDELGWLVSNHLIRRAAWQALQDAMRYHPGQYTLLAPETVEHVGSDAQAAQVTLKSGATLRAPLLVAADSRFSMTRRAMGIAADMHDFGRTMLVCCMTHAQPHDHAAWEWFDYGQTLALLPMNPDPATGEHRSSVVLTLAHHEAEPLATLDTAAFNAEMARRFAQRLGRMTLVSTRHLYPLVAVYPRRLVAQRFATVGDAAVGMHPVTAHGFNFGLRGVETLAGMLRAARAGARDIGAQSLLLGYERAHRQATLGLFLATQLVTQIYTAESPPARLLRDAMLQVGERLTPFKRLVAAALTGTPASAPWSLVQGRSDKR